MSKPTVVLIHGLWFNRIPMAYLAWRFRRAGYRVVNFGYWSALQPFERSIARLVRFLHRLDAANVHLVGHSMGGVLILSALSRMPEFDRGRVLALGSPLRGASAGVQLARHALGRFCLGTSLRLWLDFPKLEVPPRCETGVLAGSKVLGLGSLVATLEGVNDGVVSVAETRLPGLAAHRVLPVSHTGMLFSKAVAREAVAFLATGRWSDGTIGENVEEARKQTGHQRVDPAGNVGARGL